MFNRIATVSKEAAAFAFDALAPEEAAARERAYFAGMPGSLAKASQAEVFPIGPSWTWLHPDTYWTLPGGSQHEAVAATRPWKEDRFTEVIEDRPNHREFAAVRRPGYYFTLDAGAARGYASTGLGILWVPGFGNVLVSSNKVPGRPAFGWQADAAKLHDAQKSLRIDWAGDKPASADRVTLRGEGQPEVVLSLSDETAAMEMNASPTAPFYLPFVLRKGDVWTADGGVAVDPFSNEAGSSGIKSLRLTRKGAGVTHDLRIEFSSPARFRPATAPYPLGHGLFVRGFSVSPVQAQADGGFTIKFTRTPR